MTRLTLNSLIRYETDESVITNLQRKGWIIESIPIAPEYNPNLQKLIFDEKQNQYLIFDLTPKEIEDLTKYKNNIINQQIVNQKINDGYLVEPENFTLALADNDRSLFTQMISLIGEALDLGLITNDTNQIITDINNQEVTLSTLRFRQIMVGYGMYYKSLWDQMA